MFLKKKSQITMFILLGFFILIFGAIMVYIITSQVNSEIEETEKNIQFDFLNNDASRQYITKCLEDSLEETLVILGRQGGFLYDYQVNNGFSIDLKKTIQYYNVNFTNITFLETWPWIETYNNPYNFCKPPIYPCSKIHCNSDFQNSCFFIYNNSIKNFDIPLNFNFPRLSSSALSLEDQISSLVAQKTKQCVNLESFDALDQYTIQKNNVSAKVFFSDTKTVADLKFIVEVIDKQGNPYIAIQDFHAETNIRLEKIFKFLKALIKKDLNHLDFHIINDSRKTLEDYGVYNEFEIEKISDLKDNFDIGGNDLLVVKDLNTNVNGGPYEFYFLRQNMIPILDYVREFSYTTPQEFENNNLSYDFIVEVGDLIKIMPKAYDIDEDKLNFSYSGWKFNYTDNFNWYLYDLRDCDIYPRNCTMMGDNLSSPKWNVSFNESLPIITYEPNSSDIGYHEINITVHDGYLKDWQTVRILVKETTECGNVDYWNWYWKEDASSMVQEFASIEDPFWIEINGLTMPNHEFTFFDKKENFPTNILFKGNRKPFYLLSEDPEFWWEDDEKIPNILEIKGAFNNATPSNRHSDFSKHEITYKVDDRDCGLITSQDKLIKVYECLDYNSSEPIYPFNGAEPNSSQAFFGNHTCCDSDNKIKNQTICFKHNQIFYDVPLPPLDRNYSNDPSAPYKIKKLPYPANLSIGDVEVIVDNLTRGNFSVEFIAYCDGKRGNVCSGDAIFNWTRI